MRTFCYLSIAILLILGISTAVLAAEPQIADVPASHWAYQAVKSLVAQGYLGLYPDKTFRGEQPVDRYTLAVLVARLLGGAVAGQTTMGKEDADLLRRLSGEFRQELVGLAGRTKTLEEALAKYERDRVATSADLAIWQDEAGKTRVDLAAVVREIVVLQEKVAGLENSLADLDKKTAAQDAQHAQAIADNTSAVGALQAQVAQLETRLAETEKKFNILKWVAAVLAVVAVLG